MEHIELVWFAVVNPHAGSGKTLSHWKKAEALLQQKGIRYECRTTDCKSHAEEMAYTAASEGFRRFIAVGGDGTVHEVLDGIMHCITDSVFKGEKVSLADFTLAVIPIGSGNDWIRSHHIPYDVGKAVDLIAEGSFSMQDVVRISNLDSGDPDRILGISYMINIGGIGLDARICQRVNAQKDAGRSGKLLYVNSLIYNLVRFRPFHVSVECDGRPVYEGKCLSMAFGTGRYSGGGFRQTPQAVMDDGLTDVSIIRPIRFHRIAEGVFRLLNGTFLKYREVISCRARSILVSQSGPDSEIMEVDGEIVGRMPLRLDVLPDKIRVLHASM